MGSHKAYKYTKTLKTVLNEWFIFCDTSKFFFFCNSKQLLEDETKLIYIIRLKALPFKLGKVLLLKYMYIFAETQVIAHDIQAGFVTFVVYAEFRMVNVDIS